MAFGEDLLTVEGSSDTPVQQELRQLTHEIKNIQTYIHLKQEHLRIARAKLVAVKKLVK